MINFLQDLYLTYNPLNVVLSELVSELKPNLLIDDFYGISFGRTGRIVSGLRGFHDFGKGSPQSKVSYCPMSDSMV